LEETQLKKVSVEVPVCFISMRILSVVTDKGGIDDISQVPGLFKNEFPELLWNMV
jgi:hypothetical protein